MCWHTVLWLEPWSKNTRKEFLCHSLTIHDKKQTPLKGKPVIFVLSLILEKGRNEKDFHTHLTEANIWTHCCEMLITLANQCLP